MPTSVFACVSFVIPALLWRQNRQPRRPAFAPTTRAPLIFPRRRSSDAVLLARAVHGDFTNQPVTSAVFRVSFDGAKFSGWSSANNDGDNRRSVQGELVRCLARLYGNVPFDRIVVEGCSRTDKGVHATSMVAQMYSLAPNWNDTISSSQTTIPGRRKPHPHNPFDMTCFLPLPKSSPLQLGYTLNRMLPDDIRITGVARPDQSHWSQLSGANGRIGFHPTLSSRSKTYEYLISVGSGRDPVQRHYVWHVGNTLNVTAMREACHALTSAHASNYTAFRGAARSASDKLKWATQNTTCQVFSASIVERPSYRCNGCLNGCDTKSYRISVTANRFLYKMTRFIVAALVQTGQGYLTVQDLTWALQTGKRPVDGDSKHMAWPCAPPHALRLVNVSYASQDDGTELVWETVPS